MLGKLSKTGPSPTASTNTFTKVPSELPTAVATAAFGPSAIPLLITNKTEGPGINMMMIEVNRNAQ
jgi:hypothetical protein